MYREVHMLIRELEQRMFHASLQRSGVLPTTSVPPVHNPRKEIVPPVREPNQKNSGSTSFADILKHYAQKA